MNYLAIIDSCDNIQGVIDTVYSLESQKVKPQKIIVFHQPTYSNHAEDIAEAIKYTSVKWRINAFIEYQDNPIDRCIISNKNGFYCSFNAGIVLPDDTFLQIQNNIKNGLMCAIIVGNNNQGNIVPFHTYSTHMLTFNELINYVKEKHPNLGKNITEICPNFPLYQHQ